MRITANKVHYAIYLLGASVFLAGCQTIGRGPSSTHVSLVELLASPDKHVGQRVGVSGFYHAEVELAALFLSKDDARFDIYRNGIFLYQPLDKQVSERFKFFNDIYITVYGTVTRSPENVDGDGLFKIGLGNIEEVRPQPGQ